MAAAVAVNILWSGSKVVKESLSGLMDEAVPQDTLETVRRVISQEAGGAMEAHDLRTRHAGSATFIDFHLVVPGETTVFEAHEIRDRIDAALRDAVPGAMITIHVEPEHKQKHSGVLVLDRREGAPSLFRRLRDWARAVKRGANAPWIAARDPWTPLAATIVAAYAFSPIDLIPDFIRALGYLDDAVLLLLGILLAIRLIPESLMTEFREAASPCRNRPVSRMGLAAVLATWVIAIGGGLWFMVRSSALSGLAVANLEQ